MPEYKWFNPKTDPKMDGIIDEIMTCLDGAREDAGIPITITSGRRSPEYNAKVGGVPNSKHVTGEAADILCLDSEDAYKLIHALMNNGAQQIVIGVKRIEGRTVFHNIHIEKDSNDPRQILAVKFYS